VVAVHLSLIAATTVTEADFSQIRNFWTNGYPD